MTGSRNAGHENGRDGRPEMRGSAWAWPWLPPGAWRRAPLSRFRAAVRRAGSNSASHPGSGPDGPGPAASGMSRWRCGSSSRCPCEVAVLPRSYATFFHCGVKEKTIHKSILWPAPGSRNAMPRHHGAAANSFRRCAPAPGEPGSGTSRKAHKGWLRARPGPADTPHPPHRHREPLLSHPSPMTADEAFRLAYRWTIFLTLADRAFCGAGCRLNDTMREPPR